ncbi:MAG: AAA family ATPase [FCB group bacterium]|nr:AAA family ATPase [FCB group bacterium]
MKGSQISGQVTKLFFASEDFCAGVLKTDSGQSVRFSVKFPLKQDENCKLKGGFKRHIKYGWQFEATSVEKDMPVDPEGLIRFLSESESFKGIGKKRALEIVAICDRGEDLNPGNNFEDILQSTPEKFLKVKGVTTEIIKNMAESWMESRDVNSAITVLAGYNLSMNQISKVIKKFGSMAVHIVKENPYSLVEAIDGFGFRRADEIALKAGLNRNSQQRIDACLVHLVKEELSNGDTWIEERELVEMAVTVLQLSQLDAEENIHAHLDRQILIKKLTSFSYHSTSVIALPKIYKMERVLLDWLKSRPLPINDKPQNEMKTKGMTRGQSQAFLGALSNSQYLVSGPAGSGKTYLLKKLVDEFEIQDLSIILCAPTGKAARRMEEVCEISASTIHKLLGYDGRGFNYHKENKLDCDVLIIDEVSMIDLWLFYSLMDAIDLATTRIIYAGDHNQLPPVGPGNVLRDILQQHLIPYTVLDEVVRQAGTLKKNSLQILNGVVHGLRKTDSKSHDWKIMTRYDNHSDLINCLIMLYRDILPSEYKDLLRDVQVLSPMKKTDIGVIHLNRILQRLLQELLYGRVIAPNPKGSYSRIYPGDKIIQTQNDYKLGIMNGQMGIVEKVDYQRGKFSVEFETVGRLELNRKQLQNVSLAYCLTVHKVQGSEFPCVISVVHSSHYIMLHQNLFYTSVSRAKKQGIILGDMRGIRVAVKNRQVDKRKTFLSLMGETR